MWILEKDQGTKLYLPMQKTLVFGRKSAHITLEADNSISRMHASITVTPKDGIKLTEPLSACILKDLGSKYGTYMMIGTQKHRLAQDKEYNVASNNTIIFGLKDHVFTAKYVPIIVSGSLLNEKDKKELKTIINAIDGVIVSEWSRCCTHLTVSIATLTEKVGCALACGVPVVTMDYWKMVLEATKTGSELPDPKKYIPSLNEKYICNKEVSLLPNKTRQYIFKDLVFVHMSAKQFRTYNRLIGFAGGKSILYTKTPIDHKNLCARNVIVLQYLVSEETQSTTCNAPEYDEIFETLSQKKRRMIPESEIPLAILYCSTEKYCNPTYNFANTLKNTEENTRKDLPETLVIDTQDILPSTSKTKNIVLPETYDSSLMESQELPINTNTNKDIFTLPKISDSVTIEIVKKSSNSIPATKTNLQQCEVEIIKQPKVIIPESLDSDIEEIPSSPTLPRDNLSMDSLESRPSTSKIEEEEKSSVHRIIPETLQSSSDENLAMETEPSDAPIVMEAEKLSICRISSGTNDEDPQKSMISKTERICISEIEKNEDSSEKHDSTKDKINRTTKVTIFDGWVSIQKHDNESFQASFFENNPLRENKSITRKRKSDEAFGTSNCAIIPFESPAEKQIDLSTMKFEDILRKDKCYIRFRKVPVKIPAVRLGWDDFYVYKKP